LTWNVGDVAYIRPRNSQESVKQLFEIFKEHNLDINAKDVVILEDTDGEFNKIKQFLLM